MNNISKLIIHRTHVIICHPEMKRQLEKKWFLQYGHSIPDNILLWEDNNAPMDTCYVVNDVDIKFSILKKAGYIVENEK